MVVRENKKLSEACSTCILEAKGLQDISKKSLITDLHEKAGDQRSADVDVIVSAGELCALSRQVESVHDPRQLLPYIVSRHQRAVVDKVIVAPLSGVVVCVTERGDLRLRAHENHGQLFNET